MKFDTLYEAEIAKFENLFSKFTYSEVPSRVNLLGTKEVALRLLPLLESAGIEVLNVYDSESSRHGQEFFGRSISPFCNSEVLTIVCAYNSKRVLEHFGEHNNLIEWTEFLFRFSIPGSLPWNCLSFGNSIPSSHIATYKSLFERCVDVRSSEELVRQIVARYYPWDNGDKYSKDPEFCSREYSFISESSVILDGGAFDGDTAKTFLSLCSSDKGPKIVCVESDLKSIQRLLDNYDLEPRVTAVNTFLSNTKDLVAVNPTGTVTSTKSDDLTSKLWLPSSTIDEINEIWNLDFIKLDIEGSESLALKGAAKTIAQAKAVFAVSIYHKPEDILELSAHFDENYMFGFTASAQRPWDSTMYAIPTIS